MKILSCFLDILSFLAAIRKLGNEGSPVIAKRDCIANFNFTNRTCIPRHLRDQPQGIVFPDPSNNREDGSSNLKSGNMIELYGEHNFFAVPAIITGYSYDEVTSSLKYDLYDIVRNSRYAGVAAEFIHPYETYQDGTKAFCNIGSSRKVHMTLCTIESHFIKGSGFISYEISYSNGGNVEFKERLPFSKVQRNLKVPC
eukprot:CAMPEP_0183741190 /NCGR_PEP_ID=MMETSP0737-20130205/61505_1 /TAXON_ID=385413 /ORGANISM="Thalassiosira miniscula, Strain CCMP1093" /LENGTH=197 /DNA_ID=CAMNT_0025976447 /DNA_START=412 /DNA_END=1005 /DNA_ORIENTATION=-